MRHLAVGRLLADSLGLFGRWFWIALPLGLLPTLLKLMAALMLAGGDPLLVEALIRRSAIGFGAFVPKFGGSFTMFSVIELVVTLAVATALIALADALRRGALPTVSNVVRITIRRVPALCLALILIALALAAVIGGASYLTQGFIVPKQQAVSIALVIGVVLVATYLSAVWSVALPSAVTEQAAFRSLSRSARLTKGHRLTIGGLMLILTVVFGLLSVLHGMAGLFFRDTLLLYAGLSAALIAEAAFFAITLFTLVHLHAQLREIAEGETPEALENIFH